MSDFLFAHKSVDLCINISYLSNTFNVLIFIPMLTFLSVFNGHFLIPLPCFSSALTNTVSTFTRISF